MPRFGRRSHNNLMTAHTDLQRLFREVVKHFDCAVICGYRNEKDQTDAYRNGFSSVKWPNGKHNKSPAEAVDVIPWFAKKPHVRWSDIEEFVEFGGFVLGVASQMGIKINWGGHWKKFKDLPHFQLRR